MTNSPAEDLDRLFLDGDGKIDFTVTGALGTTLRARVEEFSYAPAVQDTRLVAAWLARRMLAGPPGEEFAPLVLALFVMGPFSEHDQEWHGPEVVSLCRDAFAAVDPEPLTKPCPHDPTGHPGNETEFTHWPSIIEGLRYGEEDWDILQDWLEERAFAEEDGEDMAEFDLDNPRPTVAGWDCPKHLAELAADAVRQLTPSR